MKTATSALRPVAALALWTAAAGAEPVALQCLEGITTYIEDNRQLFSFDARNGYMAVQGIEGFFPSIQLWDISNPGSPSPIGLLSNTGGFEPQVITIAYPLVAATDCQPFTSELRIFDFSDPNTPAKVGTVGAAVELAEIVGQTIYLIEADSLKIYDIANPAQPSLLGTLPGLSASAILAVGDHLYLAGDSVRIIDVSNPAQPTQIGSFPAVGGGGIDRVADSLFVTDSTGLLILDIADPTTPTERSSTPLNFFRGDVTVIEGVAFVGGPYRGIARVDVSDPDAPQVLDPLTGPHLTGPVALAEDAGSLFALGLAGFSLIEAGASVASTTSLVAQTTTGLLPANARVSDARFSGGVGFFADEINRTLTLVDPDPSGPTIIGTPIAIPFEPSAVEVAGNVAFVAGDGDQLLRFDVSDPANPVGLPSLTMPVEGITKMRVRDGRLLIASDATGFAIYDVTDPAAPVFAGPTEGGDGPYITDIDAEGDKLAIIWISQQPNYSPSYLTISDISDPGAPVGVGTIMLDSWARSLAVHDGVAFVVQADTSYDFYYPGTLAAFDISAAGTPQLLDDIHFDQRSNNSGATSEFSNLLIQGDRAYVGYRAGSTGLAVIDISDPADLRLAASSPGPVGPAFWLDADADMLYAPAGVAGFATYLNTPCRPGCAAADIAEPFGALNFFDLAAYLDLFNTQDPDADLAGPFGVFNFFDLSAYLDSYNAGCP
jgi:hypothetical protein